MTPLQEIAKAILEGEKPRDPVSTKPEELFEADFVFQLDKACQDVINFIIANDQQTGDILYGIPGCKRNYKIVRALSALELKRMKKDFLSLAKLHPPQLSQMGDTFLDFLNTRNLE